jgi:hypothetical protein
MRVVPLQTRDWNSSLYGHYLGRRFGGVMCGGTGGAVFIARIGFNCGETFFSAINKALDGEER